jgi:hypothetical protein
VQVLVRRRQGEAVARAETVSGRQRYGADGAEQRQHRSGCETQVRGEKEINLCFDMNASSEGRVHFPYSLSSDPFCMSYMHT